MSDPALSNVLGGSLKIKGGIKKKKKKSKKNKETKERKEAKEVSEEFVAEERPATQSYSEVTSTMTDSERRFHEVKMKRDIERAKKAASESHRQRVDKFNQLLGSMSEHYDIPRVGPG